MDTHTERKAEIFSRREVEAFIASGRSIVVVEGKVLKVDAWLPYHPGGETAIQHMIGRDATDEVTRCVYVMILRLVADDNMLQLPFLTDPQAHESLSNWLH